MPCGKTTKRQRLFGYYAVRDFLAECKQQIACIDGGAGCYGDGGNTAALGSDNLVLHLHGFDDHNDLAGCNGITGILAKTQNRAGQGRGDIGGTAGCRSSGRRSSGSGSGSMGCGGRCGRCNGSGGGGTDDLYLGIIRFSIYFY